MFSFLGDTFNFILYKPLFNALIILYNSIPGHDFGISIIILTVAIRILLYPIVSKSVKSQKVLQDLQPKIEEIQKKFKGYGFEIEYVSESDGVLQTSTKRILQLSFFNKRDCFHQKFHFFEKISSLSLPQN